MQDYQKTIISQYSDSPTLTQLITNLNTCLDPAANLQQFYDLIWNVETAQGYGLDVWGRIVGINRILASALDDYFGFFEALDTEGFTVAPFYSGQQTTENVVLDDEAFRLLIYAKASTNITDGSIRSINAIMMNLFPLRGNAYVTDGANNPLYYPYFGFAEDSEAEGWGQEAFGDFGANPISEVYFGFDEADSWEGFGLAPFYAGEPFLIDVGNMTMSYVFDFHLQPFERDIVISTGALPKPVGVLAYIYYR